MVRDRLGGRSPKDRETTKICRSSQGHLCAKEGRQLSETRSVIENSAASPVTGSRPSLTQRAALFGQSELAVCALPFRMLFSILALVEDGPCDQSHAPSVERRFRKKPSNLKTI